MLNAPFQKAPLIQVVDTQKLRIIGRVTFTSEHYPSHIAISPRGDTLYLSDGLCAPGCVEALLEISAANLQITGQISVSSSGDLPGDIVITKDGSTAYMGSVISPSQAAISVVDLTKGLLTATIALPGNFAPQEIALAPGERMLYATPGVWAIDVQQRKVIATLADSGVTPWDVAVSPDSKLVYVTNSAGDSMLVITAPPNGVPQVSGAITLPGPSYGVAFGR